MSKRLRLLLSFLAGLAVLAPSAGGAQPAPYELNAVLALTGSAAFLGSKEAQTLTILEGVVNQSGGIGGRPLKIVVADDTSSPQIAVQLTNGLIAKHVPAIIGSSVAGTCSAMLPLIDKGGPVTYCLSPLLAPSPGSFGYSTSVGSRDFEPLIAKFAAAKGWTRVAMINSIDATGQDMEKNLTTALSSGSGKGIQIVANEHFAPADLSVTAQMARIKAAQPNVIMAFATGTSFATVMHGISDAGIDAAVIGSAGNMAYAQLEQYNAFLPKQLFFFTGGGVVADPTATGKLREAQTVFANAFKAAAVRPDYASTLVWDPAMVLVSAVRKLGPSATAAQINGYLQSLRGWIGIGGPYDFVANPQRGLGPANTVIYQWSTEKKALDVVGMPR